MRRSSYDEIWRKKLLEWKTAGVSAFVWCLEQGIDYSVFSFWYKRLFPEEVPPTAKFYPQLADYLDLDAGVVFERLGILLHVPSGVEARVLKLCLEALRNLA